MSTSSGSSSSKSGQNRRSGEARRPTRKEREALEEEFTSPPPPKLDFDNIFSKAAAVPDPPAPAPPQPPRRVEKAISFASLLKKPEAPGNASKAPSRAPPALPDRPAPPQNPPSRRVEETLSLAGAVKKPGAPSNASKADCPVGQSTSPIPETDELQSLKEDFEHLLKNQGKTEGRMSDYERRAVKMAQLTKRGERDLYTLKVNFLDLLADDRYIALAVRCSQDLLEGNKWHGWLQPIARDFLNKEFALKEDEKVRLGFSFFHEAKSVKPLCDYSTSKLVKQANIFCDKYELPKTTYAGRHVYLSVVQEVIEMHNKGRSWSGSFSIGDIFIIQYENGTYGCRIVAVNKVSSDLRDNVADFQKVNTVVTPKYKVKDMFPAYFDELQEEFETLTVKMLRDSSFVMYLPFNFAFMTPKARRFLLQEFYLFAQSHRLDSNISKAEYKLVFDTPMKDDWRPLFKMSKDPILKGVYDHENSGGTATNHKDEKKGTQGLTVQRNDKFDRTAGGCLSYERHVVQHAAKHLCKFSDSDDSELYAAWKIPKILPYILKKLFSGKTMKLAKELGDTWTHYCRMRDVRDEI